MRFAAVFFNAGFIALPLAQALIHTPASYEGALYAAVYLAVFNIALWTWRLVDMSKKSGCVSRNPGIIGVANGMIFFTSPLLMTKSEGSNLSSMRKKSKETPHS